MRNYEIKKTIHGPAVIYQGEILFLDQTMDFFELIDDNPEFLFDITEAVADHLEQEIDLMLSAIRDRHTANSGAAYTAIAVVSHYWRLVLDEYPIYSQAMLKAQGEDATWDMSNPKKELIHRFYTKGKLNDN